MCLMKHTKILFNVFNLHITNKYLFLETQDFPARVQRQVFDDMLDREVQRGKKGYQKKGFNRIIFFLSQ